MRGRWVIGMVWLAACGPHVALPGDGGVDATGGSSTSSSSSGPVQPGSSDDTADTSSAGPHDVGTGGCAECSALDVLFVIDNSAQMADLQLVVARELETFVTQLAGRDVQVMVTTTDVGNPSCTPFQRPDYTPARGAPIATGCNARINRFTELDPNDPDVRDDACTSVCPYDVVPADPFVAFHGSGNNVIGGTDEPADVVAALQCLLPQGIDGCGYEAPLEAMIMALDPNAPHNQGARPFVRDGADLAIAIVTNEADCSVADYGVMTDPTYWNVNPDGDQPQPSSALCWNAGVACGVPDAEGVYDDCVPIDGPLQPVARYRDLLASLRDGGKRVTMLSLGGVPPVTQHDAMPPHGPLAGGLSELVYRGWRESDLWPDELEGGVSPEDLEFDVGIGPACSTEGIRALPNPRVVDVCQSLDVDDEMHCCIESACGDIGASLACMLGTQACAHVLLPCG